MWSSDQYASEGLIFFQEMKGLPYLEKVLTVDNGANTLNQE